MFVPILACTGSLHIVQAYPFIPEENYVGGYIHLQRVSHSSAQTGHFFVNNSITFSDHMSIMDQILINTAISGEKKFWRQWIRRSRSQFNAPFNGRRLFLATQMVYQYSSNYLCMLQVITYNAEYLRYHRVYFLFKKTCRFKWGSNHIIVVAF